MLSSQAMVSGLHRICSLYHCILSHDKTAWRASTWCSPCRVYTAACSNQEWKEKGKPGPALLHTPSYFLGSIKGKAQRSISSSVASPTVQCHCSWPCSLLMRIWGLRVISGRQNLNFTQPRRKQKISIFGLTVPFATIRKWLCDLI